MVLSTGIEKMRGMSMSDYDEMINYIRAKEYSGGLRDALIIMENSSNLEDATKKINVVLQCCESMRYRILKDMFTL